MPTFCDTASFGKRQEYSAVAELLKRGFDVYMTLVDDQGIDCVVRLDRSRYVDVQIKARSRTAQHWNFFAALKFTPRDNLYFIFYTERNNAIWTVPSRDVARLSARNRAGKNIGKRAISFPRQPDGIKAARFAKYLDDRGFELLRGFRPRHLPWPETELKVRSPISVALDNTEDDTLLLDARRIRVRTSQP